MRKDQLDQQYMTTPFLKVLGDIISAASLVFSDFIQMFYRTVIIFCL